MRDRHTKMTLYEKVKSHVREYIVCWDTSYYKDDLERISVGLSNMTPNDMIWVGKYLLEMELSTLLGCHSLNALIDARAIMLLGRWQRRVGR